MSIEGKAQYLKILEGNGLIKQHANIVVQQTKGHKLRDLHYCNRFSGLPDLKSRLDQWVLYSDLAAYQTDVNT